MQIKQHGLFTENVDLTKQIKDLYPTSTYKARPPYALHYLIALGQPLQTIADYIIKYPQRLSAADPDKHGLTPLHVAAMKGDLARAEVLINACNNKAQLINQKDSLGWTPLHFAAVTCDVLFKYFIELGGNTRFKTNKGADCDDLLKLTGRMRDIRSSKTLYVKNGGELILLSEMAESAKVGIFGKGFYFTDSSLYPKKMFHQLYLNDDEDEFPEFKNFALKLYETYRMNPPSLYIDQCEEMKEISPYFLDCKAKKKISSGNIISEYSGIKEDPLFIQSFIERFSEKTILHEKYILGVFNGKAVGNEARFYNSGFPNAFFVELIVRGVKRPLMIALRDIEPGEAIRWDYGIKGYSLSFGRSLLLGKEEMVSFFQKNKHTFFNSVIEGYLNFIRNPSAENFIKKTNNEVMVFYVLNSPTALLYLHFHDIVDYKVWKQALEDVNNPCAQAWKTNNSTEYLMLLCIFDTLSKLDKFCANDFKQLAAEKLEKQSVIHILKGLDLLVKKAQVNDTTLQEIDQILADYDWQKDLEKYPFNLERRASLFLELTRNMNIGVPKDLYKTSFEKARQTLPEDSDIYQIYSLMINKP